MAFESKWLQGKASEDKSPKCNLNEELWDFRRRELISGLKPNGKLPVEIGGREAKDRAQAHRVKVTFHVQGMAWERYGMEKASRIPGVQSHWSFGVKGAYRGQ
jgi:hypothetical protein